jgi:predicted alpha/beta-hydrolase family hydrolase
MTHPFMAAVADGLARRGIATLRFQFPYMESGSRRPDRPGMAHAAVRAAVDAAVRLTGLALFAGGKSFGGRMTSQAQAVEPLPSVKGLVFIGFPLHAANRPSVERARHLASILVPQLFLQGSRDTLADIVLLSQIVEKLRATLQIIPGADHSFHVPLRSGRTAEQVMDEMLDAAALWMHNIIT